MSKDIPDESYKKKVYIYRCTIEEIIKMGVLPRQLRIFVRPK